MHVASFQIQLGAVTSMPLTREQATFHRALTEKLKGQAEPPSIHTCGIPVSHHETVHEAVVLPDRIVANLRDAALQLGATEEPLDFCIIDFCSTPYFVIRDPLLLEMVSGIAESCEGELCNDFALLLPKMPGSHGAFRSKLRYLHEIVPTKRYVISLLSNDGALVRYEPGKEQPEAQIGASYATMLNDAYGDYQSRIERKCVRRLGHFATQNPKEGKPRCRHYSYIVHDCGTEMTLAFRQWWEDTGCTARIILYDLTNNDLMRDVVVAHADHLNIRAERIVDVLSNEALTSQIRHINPGVIVLDAIETGQTLLNHIENLRNLGIETVGDVFVTVNKHGDRHPTPPIRIRGLITRPSEPPVNTCEQCGLRLPFTSDGSEQFIRIRSYDLHHMISEVGWEKEPPREVPSNIGLPYILLPDFTRMLERYGDWIAYKLYNAILDHGVPEAWFIIHPAEADSSFLSQRLYDCADHELSIVSVPRDRIKTAQANGNSWREVLSSSAHESWAEQLNDMRGASAVVLDIFNGSDSTCKTLIELVLQLGLQPLAYSCVVDFNPNRHTQAIDGVRKLALYEWYQPRVLL